MRVSNKEEGKCLPIGEGYLNFRQMNKTSRRRGAGESYKRRPPSIACYAEIELLAAHNSLTAQFVRLEDVIYVVAGRFMPFMLSAATSSDEAVSPDTYL